MPTPTRSSSIDSLRRALSEGRGDRELLAAFACGDEGAFAELVRRHGPMVLGVCERVLGNRDDAEDAYQSTFLMLAERGGRGDWRESLGGWLHDVAWRTATKLRAQAARRRAREQKAPTRAAAEAVGDWPEVLDEEVRRLPAAMREAVVCCYFQGLTRQQAADKLGWSLRTLERRLEEGRQRLRQRLEARGEPIPALLAGPAFSLTSVLGRWWLVAGLLLVSGTVVALPRSDDPVLPRPVVAAKAAPPAPVEPPLPAGAIARLGETRFRHGYIHNLTVSPDGKVLASSGEGRAVCLWEASTGRLQRDFSGPSMSSCYNVAFSPDGRQFVSGMSPLRIIDSASGKVVRHLTGHKDSTLWGVHWSDDGKWIASKCVEDAMRVWDAATGEQRHVITKYRYGSARHFAFTRDSKGLLTINSDGFYALDLATGKERQLPLGKGAHVAAVAFSRDGKRLAIAEEMRRDVKEPAGVKRVASDRDPCAIRLWDVDGKSESRSLLKADQFAQTLAFAPGDKQLAVGCRDGSVRLVDVETGKVVRRWAAHNNAVSALAFAPDSKVLFSSGDGTIRVRRWDPATGLEIGEDVGHSKRVKHLRFHADAKTLVSVGADHRIIHWNLATHSPSAREVSVGGRESINAIDSEGKVLVQVHDMAKSNAQGEIGLFNARTGRLPQVLEGHLWNTFGVALDQQGKRLAWTGTIASEVRVWDLADGKSVWHAGIRVPGGVQPNSSPLRLSRDGRLLVVGGYEPVVLLFDAATGKHLHRFEHAKEPVYAPAFAADFSLDGALVAFPTGWHDTPIVLLETRTGKARRAWRSGQTGGLSVVEFSPEGRLLATASHYDETVKLWDVLTGRELASFSGRVRGIFAAAFSPDGRVLASGAADSLILLWDVTGRSGRSNKALTPEQLADLWNALADVDAKRAYAATWELALSPDGAVPFLRGRMTPVKAADAALVERLAKQLGGDDFAAREKASRELERLGGSAVPQLRKLLAASSDLEVRRRLEAVIAAYLRGDEWQRQRQTLAVLERGGGAAARKLVDELSRGADGAPLTEEARAVLARRR